MRGTGKRLWVYITCALPGAWGDAQDFEPRELPGVCVGSYGARAALGRGCGVYSACRGAPCSTVALIIVTYMLLLQA